MSILVVNAGSSSVKFAMFRLDDLMPTLTALLDWHGNSHQASLTLSRSDEGIRTFQIDAADYRAAVATSLKTIRQAMHDANKAEPEFRVVGHRLIHGGEELRRPVRIDSRMKETIAGFAELAPLHIPPGLEAIAASETALPGVPQVGVFDTAFFGEFPPEVFLYPLPYEWYRKWGIRRFGYHGISHQYCSQRAAEMLDGDSDETRIVICHLGQGASLTAVRGGVAVNNTMGFTPLEGLMMGTRSGTVDPGILLHVQREHRISVDELDDILHKQSGLLGLSGVSSDFRKVEAAAASGNSRAQHALLVYAHRVREQIGAYAVTLGGLDALVFTGGIGENSTRLRRDVCRGLECLGANLDNKRNEETRADGDIATADSCARILVIHTRENLLIARQARELVADID
ncbi:MAG: acetate/propionate family kinase [Fuerstiella sp.]|nr:acetate/propionate family kinase [Fuerstiella sp.]